MKLNEALAHVGDNWLRPVQWAGLGQAYCVEKGLTKVVPSSRGGDIGMVAIVDLLVGDWEIVAPGVVLDEREQLIDDYELRQEVE